jgi:hypothetical protein
MDTFNTYTIANNLSAIGITLGYTINHWNDLGVSQASATKWDSTTTTVNSNSAAWSGTSPNRSFGYPKISLSGAMTYSSTDGGYGITDLSSMYDGDINTFGYLTVGGGSYYNLVWDLSAVYEGIIYTYTSIVASNDGSPCYLYTVYGNDLNVTLGSLVSGNRIVGTYLKAGSSAGSQYLPTFWDAVPFRGRYIGVTFWDGTPQSTLARVYEIQVYGTPLS